MYGGSDCSKRRNPLDEVTLLAARKHDERESSLKAAEIMRERGYISDEAREDVYHFRRCKRMHTAKIFLPERYAVMLPHLPESSFVQRRRLKIALSNPLERLQIYHVKSAA